WSYTMYPPLVFGEKAMTWVPWVETILPFLSLWVGSTEMCSESAAAWMVEKSPVRPMICGSMPLSHLASSVGVSRAGSVVTKTARSFAWSALDSDSLATAMLFIVSGQMSGQWV